MLWKCRGWLVIIMSACVVSITQFAHVAQNGLFIVVAILKRSLFTQHTMSKCQCAGINDLSRFSLPLHFVCNACHPMSSLLSVPHKPPPVVADLLTEMPNQRSNGSMWRCSRGVSYGWAQGVILMGLLAVAVKSLVACWLCRHHSSICSSWHLPYISSMAGRQSV